MPPANFAMDNILSQATIAKTPKLSKPVEVAYQNSMSTKLLVLNSKGGCGKSTFTMALCRQLLNQSKKVEIIDLDVQQTAFHWGSGQDELRATRFQFQRGRFFSLVVRVLKETDVTVIDTPSSFNHDELGRYLTLAQKIIIPIQPTSIDIHAALNFIQKLTQHPIYKQRRSPIALIATRCLSSNQFILFNKVFSHLNFDILGYMSADIAYIEQFDFFGAFSTNKQVQDKAASSNKAHLNSNLDKKLWSKVSRWVTE
ncbi:ParA family protein [Shewanella psychrophila]|nr:ParA family protein [Shewanella psychrophila]